jgi:hypothetical protein
MYDTPRCRHVLLPPNHSINHFKQRGIAEWLVQLWNLSRLASELRGSCVAASGDEDRGHVMSVLAQRIYELDAADSGKIDVRNEAGKGMSVIVVEKILCRFERYCVESR